MKAATLSRPRPSRAPKPAPRTPVVGKALPSSSSVERAVIGCEIELGASLDVLPEHFVHPGRALLHLGIGAMSEAGFLLTDGAPSRTLALANGIRLGRVIGRSRLWDCATKPVAEIRECLNAYGNAEFLFEHAAKLRDLHLRREAALAGDRLAGIARDPRRDLLNVINELRAALAEAESCTL